MSDKARRTSVLPPKDQTRLKIEKMEAERQERRRAMQERKKNRSEEEKRNIAAGNPGDVDFIGMVRAWRNEYAHEAQPLGSGNKEHPRICICVRKRPVSDKERDKNDHDSVTCLNPVVCIHSAKFKVDGITKYLDHQSFRFDHAFDENGSTEDVYTHTTLPLLDFCCRGTGGRATVFAYGQTGSGKTFTMNGIQQLLCEDLFLLLTAERDETTDEVWCSLEDTSVNVSFFELYGGFVQDLLNDRNRLKLLEDGKGEIQITGLREREASNPAEFFEYVNAGNQERTTHTTQANDTSSRSHAICQVMLRDRSSGKLRGKLSLVDLAGSERGTDTTSHNAQRRAESADINTSLLSLKECIRALDMNKSSSKGGGSSNNKHVPYRGSKLTLILKDCFTSPDAMTTMIATVSPGASAADHSLNTLRYADRIKEQRVGGGQGGSSARLSPVRKKKLSPKNSSLSTVSGPTKGVNGERPVKSEAEKSRKENSRSSKGRAHAKVPSRAAVRPTTDDEEELRQTVQALFEQEEAILNLHMNHIQENAEILTTEGKLLEEVQQQDVSDADMDRYVLSLEAILDHKELMILDLQDKLGAFQKQMQREQELSKKVTLKQY